MLAHSIGSETTRKRSRGLMKGTVVFQTHVFASMLVGKRIIKSMCCSSLLQVSRFVLTLLMINMHHVHVLPMFCVVSCVHTHSAYTYCKYQLDSVSYLMSPDRECVSVTHTHTHTEVHACTRTESARSKARSDLVRPLGQESCARRLELPGVLPTRNAGTHA